MTDTHIHQPAGAEQVDTLDPANQSLAEALRKSFGVLKFVMMVLVVLYFLSGWFSVKPGEVGVVLRYGRVVGAEGDALGADAVRAPGWHWSWPYPIERAEKVSTAEREIPVQFMFQLSDEEQAGGIKGYKYNLLSPLRDDYLISGNVNILHAALTVKYRISDAVAYLTHVAPMPDPDATERSKPYTRYPEFTVLTSLVRDAVIETAASRPDVEIRGAKQNEFLQAVSICASRKLKQLEQLGAPLGISIDPANGILAPKTGGIEGIMPPRQTQQAFEEVDKALSSKVIAITKASSAAQSLLVRTAGQGYEALASAIDEEFALIRQVAVDPASEAALTGKLADKRKDVERLLLDSAGDVRNIIKRGEIKRDQLIKEASGDYEQFKVVLPQYRKNPDVFISQLRSETFAQALSNQDVGKMYVPESARGYWLQIPRASMPLVDPTKAREVKPGVIDMDNPQISN